MQTILSILGLVTAIATAITAQITTINPRVGAWVMLAGAVTAAIGGAVHKYANLGQGQTALGIIVAAAGVVALATDVIPAAWAQIIAIVGTAAAAAGGSLFGWKSEPSDPGNGKLSTRWEPPSEDKSTLRGPHRSMLAAFAAGKRSRYVIASALSAILLLQSACAQKTTLDRIGAVVVVAASAFQIEINQLCASGNLDAGKCATLRQRADQVVTRSQQFAGQLAKFGEITPGNISALTLQFAEITGFFQGLLVDAGFSPASRAVRIVQFAIDSLIAASTVIAAIHPAGVVKAQRSMGIARPNPMPSQVQVAIPKPDKDVQQALDGAGKRALGPSVYKHLRAEFGLQVAE